jgi:hypothetical protein
LTQTGGQLEISNGIHSTIFDWGSAKPTDIQWAAFTGGCEHKMHPMEKGNQIILVYNLRVTERIGSVMQNQALADASCLPLYEGVRKILELPGFMKQGTPRTKFTSYIKTNQFKVGIWDFTAGIPTITLLLTPPRDFHMPSKVSTWLSTTFLRLLASR